VRTRVSRGAAVSRGGDAIFRVIWTELPAYQGFSRAMAAITAIGGV